MKGVEIQALRVGDYDEMMALWEATPGIGLSGEDSRENLAAFLERNPGMSYTARQEGRLVGTALCGHDGRRGYIYHLAVAIPERKRGIGRALVAKCLDALSEAGINKTHVFVYGENEGAIEFWRRVGWTERVELVILSRRTAGEDSR